LNRLAERCDALKLPEQAAVSRGWFIDRDPRRQYVFLLPAATDVHQPPQTAPPLVRRWYEVFRESRRAQAERLFELAGRSVDAGQLERAMKLLHEVLREDPDHQQARAALGFRRFEQSWRSLAPPPAPQRGRMVHPRLKWAAGSYWRIETDHFRIVSSHSQQAAESLGRRLEQLVTVWRQVFASFHTTPAALKARVEGPASLGRAYRKHQVVLFADRQSYVDYLQRFEPQIEISLGFYREADRTAYFYVDPSGSFNTHLHEVTHQLFQETGRSPGLVGLRQNFWIVEGAAMYMESLRAIDDYCTLGGIDAERLQFARYRALNERFYVPLEQLTTLGRQTLQRDERIRQIYSQSAGLTHFLMDFDNGRFRRPLVAYLRQIYSGRHSDGTLASLAGADYAELDTLYRGFLQVTGDDLARLPERDQITKLCLGHTAVDDAGLAHLNSCVRLNWLDLAFTKTTDAGIVQLAAATAMDQLNLEGTQVTDLAMETIRRMTRLEELDLSGTGVTDAGLAAVTDLKGLKVLWLTGTGVTDAGLAPLYGLEQLEMLDVQGTRVTPEAMRRLRAALPSLKP